MTKVSTVELCNLLKLNSNKDLDDPQLDFYYSSNPFNLIATQNKQIVTNKYGLIKYLAQNQLANAARFSVAATLADIDEQEFLELLGNDPGVNTSALEDVAQKTPVVKLVDAIINEAYTKRASDIHFDPTEEGVNIRFRIDGILYPQSSPPKYLYSAIISRIKILAGLNIAEKRLPQDGRIRTNIQDHALDIRVATVPSIHGESMSLRLLDKSDQVLTLTQLGLSEYNLEIINQVFTQTNGIILTTGPTGSGKTTTLYAILQAIRTSERKILTLEDPVEYEIPGITQTQIKPKIGLTFANGLRSLLRHDPDVILVGEIRDKETAEMAIHASLTGHLVLSSIHTNDAPGAITRLLDMGIEPFLIASSLRAVVAQRLVRVLCSNCKSPNADDSFRPIGCDLCGHTGFLGRTAVTEVMQCDEQIRRAILDGSNANDLQSLATKTQMTPMLDDALAKVASGITSLSEVHRVLGHTAHAKES